MLTCLLVALVLTQSPQTAVEMTTYQMVLLKKGPAAPPADGAAMKKMADEHLARMADLNRERINLLYGPVTADADLRGIAILDVKTADDARKAFADDPFVKSGVMTVDVRPWAGPKNWFAVPPTYDVAQPSTLEPFVFGFLVRGANTSQDKAASDDIQKGHLSYMETLHAQGKLVVAGPFADDAPARGIVIYRVKTIADAMALAADDPAVKAGRLKLEAYPWMTIRGILK